MSLFSGKNLLGTPHRVSNGSNKNKLEFTPIGVSKGRNIGSIGGYDLSPPRSKSRSTYTARQPLNEHKINQSYNESSFDNTLDNFNTTINSFLKQPISSKNTAASIPPKLYPERNHILNNGMNSIKEQQVENHKLETENYNLKIKLATLTRFFDQTPEEQRELVTQNIDLKQQLMESAREIKQLKEAITDLQYLSNKENSGNSAQNIEEMRLEYKQLLNEREAKLSEYERQIMSMQEEMVSNNNHRVSDDLLDKLEHLQLDNQSLRRQIDSLKITINQLEHDNDAVGNNFDDIHEQLESKDVQIRDLQADLSNWKEKYEFLNSEYRGSTDSNNDNLKQSKQEIMHLNSKIKDLEYKYMNAKNMLEQKDEDLNKMMESINGDKNIVDKLDRRIDSLTRQLKEKDKEEYNLRSQIKALLDQRTSNKDNDYQFYESEIESLKLKEKRVSEQNNKLRIEVSELQDQLYQINTNSNSHDQRLKKLQEQKQELQDRLAYYENEYEILEKAFNNAELESDSLKSQQLKADERIINLENENQLLLKQLKSSSAKLNNSALLELENFNRKQLETERKQLIEEVDSLKFDLKRVTNELEFAKHNKPVDINNQFLDSEYQKLLMEKNKLQFTADDNEIRFRELDAKCRKLQTIIDDKESIIENLEAKVREVDRNNKLKFLVEDDEKTELLKAKSNNESKMRLLQLENENLQKEFETQINFYKNKLEILLQRQEEDIYNNNHNKKNYENQSSSIVLLLEKQLEDSQALRNEISQKLSDQIATNDDLKWKYEKLQKDNEQLVELSNAFDKNEKFVKLENSQLEMRMKKLTQELNNTTRHCSKLVNKVKEFKQRELINEKYKTEDNDWNKSRLTSKCHDLQAHNSYLQNKLDNINSKLASTYISSPSDNSKKIKLLENELHYYRAKLYDINLRSNDLEIMYQFVMNAIKNSNRLIKNDIIKLTQCGIYPDYASMNLQRIQKGDKLSFKVLSKFVLAMVRIRRRSEKAEKRKIRLFELKNEIETDKITLLE
ncbi:uncharacterized protein AC631_04369 [Debaryomyces fabryi]|uniref:Centrosomin N-terminal motif 1 domain-containing protein n=1 Tax=Debaryomyces fabryi TaxID=58627 RepID=A0A0V1PUH6_9ASCO|nr:uncharacterized protein AC631_04369 [Debaryomyces fabryi]KRZ99888.1 hypothetical protein AC631_04369 [Debaryomyces fabryi]CUM46710.1 unnamed protein product [Debaryomyces fabryi]